MERCTLHLEREKAEAVKRHKEISEQYYPIFMKEHRKIRERVFGIEKEIIATIEKKKQ